MNLPVLWPFSSLTSSPPNILYSILSQPFTCMVIPCDLILIKNLILLRILILGIPISDHHFSSCLFYFICIYLCLSSPPYFLASSPGVTAIPNFVFLIPLIFKMTLSHMYVFLNSMLFSYFFGTLYKQYHTACSLWELALFPHHSINKMSPCCAQ